MCVYMTVFLSVCVCLFMYMCVYVSVYVYVSVFLSLSLSACVCLWVCVCLYACVCVCVSDLDGLALAGDGGEVDDVGEEDGDGVEGLRRRLVAGPQLVRDVPADSDTKL